MSKLNLDLGAGGRRKDGYIAVDIDRSCRPNIMCDVHTLPLREGSIDNVYWSHNIEHVANPSKALREIHRILRAGGKLTIVCPNSSMPWNIYLSWKYGLFFIQHGDPFDKHLWAVKPEALKRLLVTEGFGGMTYRDLNKSERHWNIAWVLGCNPFHRYILGVTLQVSPIRIVLSWFEDFLYKYVNPRHHFEIKLVTRSL